MAHWHNGQSKPGSDAEDSLSLMVTRRVSRTSSDMGQRTSPLPADVCHSVAIGARYGADVSCRQRKAGDA